MGLLSIGIYYKYGSSTNSFDSRILGTQDVAEEHSSQKSPTEETQEEPFKKPYINPPPEISAKAYGVVNLNEELVMFKKNPNLILPPASVTKIMTAIVALENYDLDKSVVVPPQCTKLNGSSVGFLANEVLTLQDLLYGLLVRSGADAACAIASINSQEEFIDKMNKKADELGMTNTTFQNEIGFDAENSHFSTINDLEKLTLYALKSGVFRKLVGTTEVTLTSLNPGTSYKIKSTNDLLFTIPGTVGIKTGFTQNAGECLSYLYENKGQSILITILGSENRFGDTSKLLKWANEEIALLTSDKESL